MNCPVCEHRTTEVIRSTPYESVVVRERLCGECNARFDTCESLSGVWVYNPKLKRRELKSMTDFNAEGWADVVLYKKQHPVQMEMFKR